MLSKLTGLSRIVLITIVLPLLLSKTAWARSVVITAPENDSHVTSPLTIRGTANANGRVEVKIKMSYNYSSQDLSPISATTDANGKWQTQPINLPPVGERKNVRFKISAHQKVGRYTYNARAVIVRPTANVESQTTSTRPQIISPQANARIASPLTVSGTAPGPITT